MAASRFTKWRRILAAVAFLFIAISAGVWWRAHSAAAARAAWIKTVQDAGFQVSESVGIIALPFDIRLPAMFEEMLILRMPGVAISSNEDAQRLRRLVKTCPRGTMFFMARDLSPEESSELQRQFPNGNIMPTLMDPFGASGAMPAPGAVPSAFEIETAGEVPLTD